eukprot:snap_masked-scaffold_4-processed-gene-18.25-mRNA-1 protein AED:1.00 eAED:1.00 QI:0/-1/0/0/-1/1/1/0/60
MSLNLLFSTLRNLYPFQVKEDLLETKFEGLEIYLIDDCFSNIRISLLVFLLVPKEASVKE